MAIGNPISLTNNIAEKTSSQIAGANQAQFIVPGGYLVNKLGVYRNGVKLSQSSDYTANDGDTVNLVVPANDGDVIQFQVFDYFNVADAITTEGGTVSGTLTVEGSIVANGGVTGDLTGDVTGDISGATATFTGDVSIGGTLTYEDVTNIDSVGIITARSDLSIADKIVHTGDTDTAIRFPAADTFTVETAGSERVRITSTGDVGIGTDNPTAKLTVAGYAIFKAGDGRPDRIRISIQSDANYLTSFCDPSDPKDLVIENNNTTRDISFYTGGTNSLQIDSSGDVGIGTDNPQKKLHVYGDVMSGGNNIGSYVVNLNPSTGGPILEFGDLADTDKFMSLGASSGTNNLAITNRDFKISSSSVTNLVHIADDTGNIGIATDNPTEKLHVIGNILASGNITAFSDIKLKDNIEVIPNALDKVVQIRGVTFDRVDEEVPRQSGVIAQEVEKVLPEVVITNKDGIKSVAYGNLVGLLIESIKELKVEVNELKARLEE